MIRKAGLAAAFQKKLTVVKGSRRVTTVSFNIAIQGNWRAKKKAGTRTSIIS